MCACERVRMCVFFWGEGVGGLVERTLNYLKPFQILIKVGEGELSKGFGIFWSLK